MSRDIKFRAWEAVDKRMVQVTQLHFIDKGACVEWDAFEEIGMALEDLELMQYTGFKDKNGVEIYEGDIVKGKLQKGFDYMPNIGVIRYSFMSYVVSTSVKDYLFAYYEFNEYEVIGNIYENPELLNNGRGLSSFDSKGIQWGLN